MRYRLWVISSLSLALSCCAHGDVPKVDRYFNDPQHDGFQWQDPDGHPGFVAYKDSEALKIVGFKTQGITSLIQYYQAEIKYWKDQAQHCSPAAQ